MKKFFTLAVFLLIPINAYSESLQAESAINPVIGDVSWLHHFGEYPDQTTHGIKRIKLHLQYVIKRLQENDRVPSQKRRYLINKLKQYSEGSQFPQHNSHSQRSPRFIDHRGVPCAVGYLMIESGAGDLAKKINRAHEYDSIAMIMTGTLANQVRQWADLNGFTVSELAIIQPTYGGMGMRRPQPLPVTVERLHKLLEPVENDLKQCVRINASGYPLDVILNTYPNGPFSVRVRDGKKKKLVHNAELSNCLSSAVARALQKRKLPSSRKVWKRINQISTSRVKQLQTAQLLFQQKTRGFYNRKAASSCQTSVAFPMDVIVLVHADGSQSFDRRTTNRCLENELGLPLRFPVLTDEIFTQTLFFPAR